MALSETLTEIIRNSVENGRAAGANVLVLKNGRQAAYAEYGMRDMENKLPIERDTIFRIYSMTKPITAAAAILLASMGKIDISADIAEYLPEFREQYVNENGVRRAVNRRITVRDLLNMTSGIPYNYEDSPGGRQALKVFDRAVEGLYNGDQISTRQFCEMMAKVDLSFEPGSQFRYGAGADILGGLVERVSGMRYSDYLKKYFFEPLGMNDTDFYVPQEKAHRLSKAYEQTDKGLCECKTDGFGLKYMRDVRPEFEAGGAGLCSTVDDYSKFGAMLISGGEYGGKRIMPKAAVDFMTRGGIEREQRKMLWQHWDWMKGYGYGNLMRVCEDDNMVTLFSSKGEYGWDGWLGTFFSNEPKHGITLVVGGQLVGIHELGVISRKLKNAVMSELV